MAVRKGIGGLVDVWSVFKLALRGAIWRTTPDPPLVGLSVLVGWSFVLAIVRVAIQYVEASPSPAFTPYGLNALIAWLVIALLVAAFFVRPEARATVLSAMVALSTLTEIVLAAVRQGLAYALSSTTPDAVFFWLFPVLDVDWMARLVETGLAISFFLAPVVSWIGGMFAIVRSVQPDARLRLLGKVIALWAALFIAKSLVPHAPVFAGPSFELGDANWWEYVRARHFARSDSMPDPDFVSAQVRSLQPALLQAAVARLAPQNKRMTDLYAIGVAGWSDQDVFAKEVDGALAVLAQSLPVKDRTLRLINNPGTVETTPLASRRNFAAAVRAVGQVMDKNEDVLILFMTSHGGNGGIALKLPGGGAAVLGAQDVKAILAGEGIRHRVVIVSACYGGVFVEPMANDDTIVLTASDARSTSFGCAAGRDWTYFGDALFKQSLQPGVDFRRAFDHARILIQGWEKMDRLPPSNPQAHFGPALVEKLDPVFKSMIGQ
jgi:hypothetical protein